MFKKLAFFISLALIGCSPANLQLPTRNCGEPNLPPEDSPNSATNDFGGLIMWDQEDFPIRVIVDPEMRTERKQVVFRALQEWNTVVGTQVFSYEEGPQNEDKGVIWINEEPLTRNECGNQLFGLASRFYYSDFLGFDTYIHHAHIRLHVGVPDDRILSTTVHELGHALGLNHDREIESIMFPTNLPERGFITEEDRDYVRYMILGPRVRSIFDSGDFSEEIMFGI